MYSEIAFYEKLKYNFDHILIYENAQLREKAKLCMNVDALTRKARQKIKSLGQDPDLDESDFYDVYLLEVLEWFNSEFFTWMNRPNCSRCGNETEPNGNATPTPDELFYGASRVENYTCPKCPAQTRFPRYNDPGKLLETKTGRCGEWANCFVLFCLALGFETRYVLDFTDHVWAEVFSKKQKRWLHCDPCENVCDEPLLYESGWGKKLTYVIAFSIDDIQDVTWRYTTKHSDVLLRRKECREEWLVGTIIKMRQERFKDLNLSKAIIDKLTQRNAKELVELMFENIPHGNLPGRESGSLAWRMARCELGPDQPTTSHIITPTPSELSNNCLKIIYNCSEDAYTRSDGVNSETVKGWGSLLFESKEMFRKVEHDWEKVYLCRTEKSFIGTLTWKVNLSGTGKLINTLRINVKCQCFDSGTVLWKILSNLGSELELEPNVEHLINEFCGSDTICITVVSSGGRGPNAWQQSQVFRQDLNSDAFPLELEMSFKETM